MLIFQYKNYEEITMNVLIIEDDKALCSSLSFLFSKKCVNVTCINDGVQGLTEAYKPYDVLIIDCMLPGTSGPEIIRKLRADGINTPITIISALGELNDKLCGFNCGADDYIVKPFEFEELYVRIISLLKRTNNNQSSVMKYGDLLYDSERFQLSTSFDKCILSKTEAALFNCLIEKKGNVCLRNELILQVWGENAYMEDGNLDNYIYFLRKKLKALQSTSKIKNKHGIGFSLTYNPYESEI